MDVCGGLISEEETIIPIPNWIPKSMTPHEASQLFLASRAHFDTYANYTVYLCARTLGVLCGRQLQHQHPHHHHPSCIMSCQYHYLDCEQESSGHSYVHQWKALFDRVEQWYEQRPSQMKAVFGVSMPGPFPTVIYGNGAASTFTRTLPCPGYTMLINSLRESIIPCMRLTPASAQAQDPFSISKAGTHSFHFHPSFVGMKKAKRRRNPSCGMRDRSARFLRPTATSKFSITLVYTALRLIE